MTYYDVRVLNKTDGTMSKAVTSYNTKDEAEIYYHKCLAADMGNAEVTSCMMVVMTSECAVIYARHWEASEEDTTEE